jgi:hypothetical protein
MLVFTVHTRIFGFRTVPVISISREVIGVQQLNMFHLHIYQCNHNNRYMMYPISKSQHGQLILKIQINIIKTINQTDTFHNYISIRIIKFTDI